MKGRNLINKISSGLKQFGFSRDESGKVLDKVGIVAGISDDGKTFRHSVGVAENFKKIGEFYGLNVPCCYVSGLLHDIGKSVVSSEIVAFDKKYNDAMYEEMKKHVNVSILDELLGGNFSFIRDVCSYHHAFQKRKPYPRIRESSFSGKRGKKVFLYAQALAWSDFADAIHRNDGGMASHSLIESKEKVFEENYPAACTVIKFLPTPI
ncbi:HD domain-containing protein [Candidatus Pacearchaeota archaeon]|nr:HD domain-containing protein [Candidatus Pacearchaeota archaeon]